MDLPAILISYAKNDLLVETILQQDGTTAFAVSDRAEIHIANVFVSGQQTFRPIEPGNNLIKHRAVLLPPAPQAFEDVGVLIDQIRDYIGRYVQLSDTDTILATCYVMLSWVYDAFNELPYLRFRGDYGTGKTRALLVIGSICHKAFFASGASTVSPIFHTLDLFRGTLVFDEADFRFTDEKAELVKILNNGNSKGFPVLRTQVSQQRVFDPRAFSIFGPKIVAMRRSYDDRALESRFLTVEMAPGRAAGSPINLPDSYLTDANELRAMLLMYRFQMRQGMAPQPDLSDVTLEPRINQILLPLLAVAPPNLRRAIYELARRQQSGTIIDRSISLEGQILEALSRCAGEAKKAIALSSVVAVFTATYGAERDKPVTGRWIASLLRGLGILLHKSNGVYVISPGQAARIDALFARYGVASVGTGPHLPN